MHTSCRSTVAIGLFVLGGLSTSTALAAGGRRLPASPAAVRTAYTAPVSPLTVLRPFQAPRTRFGPGHRGVDLAVPLDGVVHAAAPGVVTFAGSVAGRGVVVVGHGDGVRTEYEPLSVAVVAGARVGAATVLGHIAGHAAGCARCLHWGARRSDVYFDPLTLLAALGPVRLVPWRTYR